MQETGMSQSTIVNLSTSGNNPSLQTSRRIVAAFDVTLLELFILIIKWGACRTKIERLYITLEGCLRYKKEFADITERSG